MATLQAYCARRLTSLVSLLALVSFPLTPLSLFSLALTPNLSNCDAFKLAVALCALLGVGGHFLLATTIGMRLYSSSSSSSSSPSRSRGQSAASETESQEDWGGSVNAGSPYARLSGEEGGEEKPLAAAPPGRRLALACLLAVVALSVACTWGLALGARLLVRATVSPRAGRTGLPLAFPVSLSFSADGLSHVAVRSSAPSGNGSAAAAAAAAAAGEHDLWFGQGWAHARARLWQMEFQRRVGAGRLSEAVGEAGLSVDKAMRVLGVYAAAQRDFAAMASDAPERAALVAYAQGVNAFISAATPAYLPLEFRVLGLTSVEAWVPEDSLVWQKLMAWDLCGNFNLELQRFEMAYLRGVAPSRVGQLLPAFDYSAFPTILSMEELVGGQDPPAAPVGPAAQPPPAFSPASSPPGQVQGLVDAAASGGSGRGGGGATAAPPGRGGAGGPAPSRLHQAVASLAALVQLAVAGNGSSSSSSSSFPLGPAPSVRTARLRVRGGGGASNAWVVNATPSPILANDPHLQLLAPSLWYLQRLTDEASGIDVQGATFPGLPGIVIGRNRRISWGVTNTGADTQDLYVLNASSLGYIYDNALYPFTLRTEVIKVKGGGDVALPVRSTRHHGAVVSDCSELVGARVAASGVALALRWVSTDASIPDTTFAAFYGLQRAGNWKEFRAALRKWTSPSQNVVFASTSAGGDFGYQMPGYIPLRDRSGAGTANNSGAWPVPGDSSAFAWLPQPWAFEALPRALNPAKGFVATANNPAVPAEWPYFLTADWDCGGEGYRAARITAQLLQQARAGGGAGHHTVDSIARLQTDYVSLFAVALCGILASARIAPATPGGVALAARLGAWDKGMALGSAEATLFADVWARVSVVGAREGSGGERSVWEDPQFLLRALGSEEGDPACAAAGYASCAALAADALDASAAHFELQQGAREAVPRWGLDGVHLARAEHEVLHGSPLACLGDRVVGHGGDAYTVNVGGFALEDGARGQTHGPSVRHVMAGEAGQWVQPMGQEGDLLSPLYGSLLERWAGGEYLQMGWEFEVEEGMVLGP